jgi:PilZ domain
MRQPFSSKLEIPIPVRVSFHVDGGKGPADGWIARLSLAGVDIDTLDAPAIGKRVVFHAALSPESSEILSFAGTVRWVNGARFGVQFAELGAKETRSVVEAMRVATEGPTSEADEPARVFQRASLSIPRSAPEENEIPITFEE